MAKSKRSKAQDVDTLQAHPKHPGHYHVDMIAKLLNVTKRRVQQLAAEDSIPKGIEGYYPLMETVNRYCKYLQERSRGRPTGEVTEQTIAIQTERRRKLKLENDFKSAKLVDIGVINELFIETIVLVANQLDGAAGRIAGGDAVLRQRLLNEHRRIRTSIGERLQALGAMYESGTDDDPTTGPGTVGVGGSKT